MSKVASASLPFELPREMQPPLILTRGELDEIRVSHVHYRGMEWTAFQRWECDPGHGWNLTATVALQPDEWASVLAEFALPASRRKGS